MLISLISILVAIFIILLLQYTVKNGVLQYTFGGVLQDTIMPVGVV